MAGRHAILGPSSAYRWLVCTPSARFEQQIPEDESDYALEGTLAHDLAALVLAGRSGNFKGSHALFNEMMDRVKSEVIAFYMTQEQTHDEAENGFYLMLEHADAWAALIIDYGGDIYIEREFDLGEYVPASYGTADATNEDKKVLHVSDFKYGAGVPVSAKQNAQMMLYAVGAWLKFGRKHKKIVLTIFQPRAGGVSTWEIDAATLVKWAETEVAPRALLAISGEGEFTPGKHCQFCKARTRCAAYYEMFKKIKGIHDKREMTDKDTVMVLRFGSMLSTWIKKVEEETVKRMQKRKPLPGFKLVAGRGKRQFRNEDDVVDILLGAGFNSDEIFTTSLRALTDLEKELRPRRFNELLAGEVITISGKPTITTEDDERKAIGASGADEYDDIDDLL